jgi:hypothetical protein
MAVVCSQAMDRACLFRDDLEQLLEEFGIGAGWIKILFQHGCPVRAELLLRGIQTEGAETNFPGQTAGPSSLHDVRRRLRDFAVRRADCCRIRFGSLKVRLFRNRIREIKASEVFKVPRELEGFAALFVPLN